MDRLQIAAFLVGVILPLLAHSHYHIDEAYLSCVRQQTCSDCLNANSHCSWCYKKNYTFPRCETEAIHSKICQDEYDYQKPSEQKIIIDRPLTEPHVAFEASHKTVQLKPQQIQVRLRPGAVHRVEVQYRQSEDYPLDLYYLMDLSHSMRDKKEKLALLGNLLGDEMTKITRNFRLGFGSFVDKLAMPFTNTASQQRPCPVCVTPYGFRNHLPLTKDTARFVSEVKAAQVSGNVDAPEGCLDAIMQAVVCTKQIQWRKDARRILLVSTDAGFHLAGDGRLAGIVTPNDGRCHLDKMSRENSHSSLFDYPSVGQINAKIREHKVNLIFAVTENQESTYARLANMIEGCSYEKLANDSSNVVDLVKSHYEKITSHVGLTTNVSEQVGDQIQFDVFVQLKKCPKDRNNWNRTIHISPMGINERLEINLEMVCECGCETQNKKPNADECGGVGTYMCGTCSCNDGYNGKRCECKDTDSARADDQACRAVNETRLCSGRGDCRCGQCICHERESNTELVTGRYCECDNFSCDRHNGQLCGGETRGRCVCGKCHCNLGWEGADCSCSSSNIDCLNAAGDECNGHGRCHCNKCVCEPGYIGEQCLDCPACPSKCEEFKDCVECQLFPNNPGKRYSTIDNCTNTCTTFSAYKRPQLDFNEELGDTLCVFRTANDCQISFVYREIREVDIHGYRVHAKEIECPEPLNIFFIVSRVVVGVVIICLIILFNWKVVMTLHDRREYAEFLEERARAKWATEDNPMFRSAVTTFRNPTYRIGV